MATPEFLAVALMHGFRTVAPDIVELRRGRGPRGKMLLRGIRIPLELPHGKLVGVAPTVLLEIHLLQPEITNMVGLS